MQSIGLDAHQSPWNRSLTFSHLHGPRRKNRKNVEQHCGRPVDDTAAASLLRGTQLWCADGTKRPEITDFPFFGARFLLTRVQSPTAGQAFSSAICRYPRGWPSVSFRGSSSPRRPCAPDRQRPSASRRRCDWPPRFCLHTARKAAAPWRVLGPQVARWCMLSSLSSTTDAVDVSERLAGPVDERTIVPVRPGAGPPIPSGWLTRRRRPLRRGQRRCRYDRRPWMRRRSRGTLHALCRSPRRRGVDVAAGGATGVVLYRARHETRSWPAAAPGDAGSTRSSSEHDTRFGAC